MTESSPTRRPPAPLLAASVVGRQWLTNRMVKVTIEGPELAALRFAEPASSVRVLLPEPDGRLERPEWDGNRFVSPGGGRPRLRTLTPLRLDGPAGRLDLEVVVHGQGAASGWAASAPVGSQVAVSGPARGYDADPGDFGALVLGGDETAVPAIGQILEWRPPGVPVSVFVEAPDDARPPLPDTPLAEVHWLSPSPDGPGLALAKRLGRVDPGDGTRLWAAGEAAAMQRIRLQLFRAGGWPRSRATIRGYWKHGRVAAEGSS